MSIDIVDIKDTSKDNKNMEQRYKVKIFNSYDLNELEGLINTFLSTKPANNIRSVSINTGTIVDEEQEIIFLAIIKYVE